MANEPNMKVHIGADTKDFDKGARAVKQGLKDLEKTGTQSLKSLGDAFGVDTGLVGQFSSAIVGLGAKLQQTGNEGAKAFGKILTSIGPLGGAIAGLGLGAAIAGFKALKAEADNFKSTVDGMNLSMATAAYISTYQQALHDANSETGRTVAEAMADWEKMYGKIKAFGGAVLAQWFGGQDTVGLAQAWKKVSAASEEATRNAEKAEKLGSQMAELKKKELAVNNEIARLDRDIAKARRDASDKSKTAEERAAAEAEYRTKINEQYDKQIQIAKAISIVQGEMDDLASNTYDETKNTLELENTIYRLEAEREDKLKGVDKLSASIASSAAAAAAAAQKQREEFEKIAAYAQKRIDMNTNASIIESGAPKIQGLAIAPDLGLSQPIIDQYKERLQASFGDMTVYVGFKADTKQIHDLTNEVTSLLESSIARTGELIGNLVGTLAGGGDAWGDFKSAALSAFGDMAIAVGKIAISMGVAAAGIDVALKDTGQWYVAVAAGAALVALGAAVKSSLSAVASGDYSAGGGSYSGGYSSGGSSGYETREVNVNVTGTLQANGDQLVAVINNTNKKNYYLGGGS